MISVPLWTMANSQMTHDLQCVYRAADVGEADIVVVWLEEQAIAAFVKDRYGASGLYPFAVAPLGVEVCVADSEQAPRASALLEQHAADIEARKRAVATEPAIEVACEACGIKTTFPAGQRGRVGTCPNCRAYLDVPAANAAPPGPIPPAEEWSGYEI